MQDGYLDINEAEDISVDENSWIEGGNVASEFTGP